MNITIEKGTAYGNAGAPPSKSYAHRMLICAALAKDISTIHRISGSEDMLATMDCIRAMGSGCLIEGTTACTGWDQVRPAKRPEGLPVYACRESGSTLRFFVPLALALTGGGIFKGSSRLIERGIGVYEDIFLPMGVQIEKAGDHITVKGQLTPGAYTLRGDISSQFVTGLLLALPLLDGDSYITVLPPIESRDYINITIDVMKFFGVNAEETEEGHFHIAGGQEYKAREAFVEGDWSNAAFLFALQKLHDSAENPCGLNVSGLNPDSIQGDRVCLRYFEALENGCEEMLDIANCPDLGPVLFAFAAACKGGRFSGIKRLRIKESDRSAAMAAELAKCGIRTEETEDTFTVFPGTLHAPEEVIDGHNDHRIVMAMAVLLTMTGGEIAGAEAVRKSYPMFFADLNSLGIRTVPRRQEFPSVF